MGAAPRADIQTATTGETGVDIQFFGPAALQDVVEYLFCTVFVKAVVAPIRYQVTQQAGMINGRSVVANFNAGQVGLVGDRAGGAEQVADQRFRGHVFTVGFKEVRLRSVVFVHGNIQRIEQNAVRACSGQGVVVVGCNQLDADLGAGQL